MAGAFALERNGVAGRAPVQIGNRLWYDVDGDGVMSTDEEPIPGTILELLDPDGAWSEHKTDDQGEYVFAIFPGLAYTV